MACLKKSTVCWTGHESGKVSFDDILFKNSRTMPLPKLPNGDMTVAANLLMIGPR